MTEEAVPVTGMEGYYLRYGQPDVAGAENDARLGYTFFFETVKEGEGYRFKRMSYTLARILIRRGLRIKNAQTGDLVYAYPQDSEEGLTRAGEFIKLYLTKGNGLGDLLLEIFRAFNICGWPTGAFRKQTDQKKGDEETPSKNL